MPISGKIGIYNFPAPLRSLQSLSLPLNVLYTHVDPRRYSDWPWRAR